MNDLCRRLLWLIPLLLAALAFIPGLWGPFLLDTEVNLEKVKLWVEGDMLWHGVIFGNDSGPLGRPIAMASFLLNAAVTGYEPFGFKLVNLLVHLICAGLIVAFLRRLLRRDPQMGRAATLFAIGLAVWWTMLPIQVPTVLYTVQRMAQLAALFMFAGLLVYVVARERIEADQRSGHWLLWVGVPLLTLLAALSKENGLLLPLLCLVVEIGYFRDSEERPMNRGSVNSFLALTAVLPVLAFIGYFLINPDFFLGGYINRSFTFMERVLTEPRALWDYVRQILIPFGPKLGLYHDSYPVSTTLFSPLSTALAIFSWGALVGVAWWLRRAVPALFTGVFLFLFAHAMESSIFPLELVFLHRNYLPALGILLAVTGVAVWLYQRLPVPTHGFRRVMSVLLVTLALTLWSATFARAWVWQSKQSLLAHEAEQHPYSIRTRLALATYALHHNQPQAVLYQIKQLEGRVPRMQIPTVLLSEVVVYAMADRPVPRKLMHRLETLDPPRLHLYTLQSMKMLVNWVSEHEVSTFQVGAVTRALTDWLDDLEQAPQNQRVWRFRYYLSQLTALTGDYAKALRLVMRAWRDSGKRFDVGVLAFKLADIQERHQLALQIFHAMDSARKSPDLRKRRQLKVFQRIVEANTKANRPKVSNSGKNSNQAVP